MGQRCWVLPGERREWLDLTTDWPKHTLHIRLSLCASREGPHGDWSLATGTGSALDKAERSGFKSLHVSGVGLALMNTLGEVHPKCALCSVEFSQVLSLASHCGRLVCRRASRQRPESEAAVPQEPCGKKLNSSDPSIMQSAPPPLSLSPQKLENGQDFCKEEKLPDFFFF